VKGRPWDENQKKEEKNMETKDAKNASASWWMTDARYEPIAWAAIFFLGATTLLIEMSGLADGVGWWDGWAVFFLGLGTIMVLGNVVRRTLLGRRIEWFGAVCGMVLVAIGVENIAGFGWVWPALLFIIAALFLHSALARPKMEGEVDDWDWSC